MQTIPKSCFFLQRRRHGSNGIDGSRTAPRISSSSNPYFFFFFSFFFCFFCFFGMDRAKKKEPVSIIMRDCGQGSDLPRCAWVLPRNPVSHTVLRPVRAERSGREGKGREAQFGMAQRRYGPHRATGTIVSHAGLCGNKTSQEKDRTRKSGRRASEKQPWIRIRTRHRHTRTRTNPQARGERNVV